MRGLENPLGFNKPRSTDYQDFTAVVLVGYGEGLYPFTEGTNVLSKALLPVGNVPVINTVLEWILRSGITDVLLLVPPKDYTAITDHLDANFPRSNYPSLRLTLRKHTDGEKDEEAAALSSDRLLARDGTARILRRMRQYIKRDFVVLPCDISLPETLPLAKILDKHRASPETVLTTVFYEPCGPVADSEPKILLGFDKDTEDLLMVQALDALEEDLEMRMSLLETHPQLSLNTKLLDAHIYVCRKTVLDLLAQRKPRDLDSLKEQVVPWLAKGSWQSGLRDKWATVLANPPDPFGPALSRSSASKRPLTIDDPTQRRAAHSSSGSATPSSSDDVEGSCQWRCQIIVAKAEPIAPGAAKGAEPDVVIRANSLPGYWELNRRFLRNVGPGQRDIEGNANIAQNAQISPDSVIGDSVRIGERASIKKTIIGRHCNIGRGAKLTGCVLWDFVTVEENARIENAILCTNVRIGEKAQIKDCEFGTGFQAKPNAVLKNERMVAGQDI